MSGRLHIRQGRLPEDITQTYLAPPPVWQQSGLSKKKRNALILVVLLFGVLAFELTAVGAFARIAGPESTSFATANQDFALREGPRLNAPKVMMVKQGTKFQMIDSAGGEVVESRSSSPSKWFLVKLPSTNSSSSEVGWVYSGWIRR